MVKREIKFRAKTTFDNEWVYGFYVERLGYEKGMIYEVGGLGHDVNPETVGQFTGFLDDKKVEIYYDDIVKFKFINDNNICEYDGTALVIENMSQGVGLLMTYVNEEENPTEVIASEEGDFVEDYWEDKDLWEIKVIGNIYDPVFYF